MQIHSNSPSENPPQALDNQETPKQTTGPLRATAGPKVSPQPKRPLLCLVAAVLGVVLAVVCAEWTQRWSFGWPKYSPYLQHDGQLGTRMPRAASLWSRVVRVVFQDVSNSEGFRSRPLPAAAQPPGSPGRLLVIGDSFVRAWGIRSEERFGEQALLQSGLGLELDQICCDDWGPLQEWLALKQYGPQLRPQFVVLSLFVENDIVNAHLGFAGMSNISAADAIRPYWTGQVDRDGWPRVTAVHPARAAWRRHSSLFAHLEKALVDGRHWSYFTPEALALRHSSRELRFEFLTPWVDPELWEPAWRNLEGLLLGFAASVRRLGARPLVLVVPPLWQVQVCAIAEERALQLAREAASKPEAPPAPRPDYDYPERRLMGFLQQAGIDCAVALGALRRATEGAEDGLYLRDGHLNHLGHITLGGVLAQWLTLVAGASEPPPEGLLLGDLDQGPRDLLPRGATSATCLDFSTGLHLPLIAYGINWRREPGWLGIPARMAEVVEHPLRLTLRADPGELVIRGSCAGDRGFPLKLRIAAYSNILKEELLNGPGEFEVHCPNPVSQLIESVPVERRPYLPLAFDFTPADGAALPPIGLRWLGFCPGGGGAPAQLAPDK